MLPVLFVFCFFVVWFSSFAVFWQSSLFLRVGLCDKFSGANFCFLFFVFFSASFCFWWGLAYVFVYYFASSPWKFAKKFSSCQVLFLLARSLCLRVWVDDVFVVSLLSLFSFSFTQERKLRANRTPHPPPPHVLFVFFLFFFCPRRVGLFACSGRASFLFWLFSSGCHSGPRALFGLSRDFSEAFFLDARRQRRLLDSFLWSFVFPVLWCLRPRAFLDARVGARRRRGR